MLMLSLIRSLVAVIRWALRLGTRFGIWALARSLCMPEPVVHDTGVFVFAQVQTFETKVGKSLCPIRLLSRLRAYLRS